MIGFELSATSNAGFQRNYSSWTEGSMWLVKGFKTASGLPSPIDLALEEGVSAMLPGIEDLIEPAFRHILRGYLIKLAGIGHEIGVSIYGEEESYSTYYVFDPEAGGRTMVQQFLQHLRWASDAYRQELGDQVMIHLCKTITDFDDHLAVNTPGKIGFLWITIRF